LLKSKKSQISILLGMFILFGLTINSVNFNYNIFSQKIMSYPSQQSIPSLDFKIKSENSTQLNGSSICYYEINVYRFEAQNITFNYTDTNTNQTITGANATYYWYEKGDTSNSGNGTLIELGNGLYTLNFNTSARAVGEFVISVNIKKDNCTEPNMVVLLSIIARPTTFLSLTGTMLKLERGIVFPVLFYLEDSLNKTKLNDLSIKWTMGFLIGNLLPLSNGFYILPFPTQGFEIGSNIIIIDPSSTTNYDISTTSVQIEITWEKILGIDLPIFYSIIIISIIIIAAILGYIIYKRISKPFAIKKINECLKKIELNERPISTDGIRNREEIYKIIFKEDWQSINKKPKFKNEKTK